MELTARSSDEMQLTAGMVSQRMSTLILEFSSSAIYYQWNSTLDELAGIMHNILVPLLLNVQSSILDLIGEIVATVEQLQSQEFLHGVMCVLLCVISYA